MGAPSAEIAGVSNPRLTPHQVEQYRAEGYLLVKEPVLPEYPFQQLRAHFDAKLRELPDGQRPESMDVPHFSDPKLFDWLLADEVLDLVEPILGPDIALYSSHFICKPGTDGRRVPWHEDSSYWNGVLDPMQVCTVWLALDPSTRFNGCMHVIPRTHRNGYSEYQDVSDPERTVFGTEIKASQRDDSKAVALELEPNQASLHDARLMHSSPANTSGIRRCGYTMRYIPTTVKFKPRRHWYFQQHQIYLARGRDRAGNQYADPGRSYDELAAFRRGNKYGH
ncbi:MAG TPA: phytanoyl-CoA dioxygenase family protein [Polyangiaceae bacterium]|jgi:chlorinating enzyme